MFFRVTEATFNHRRKKIGTSLRTVKLIGDDRDIPFLDSRVEELRPAEIGDIANAISLKNEKRPDQN
jgi:16S rRNA (adenine1518-N6/adenine1519-N6)-dimethyltransferase